MAEKRNFDYLKLLRRESGPANLTGGGPQADKRTLENRTDRTTHSANLRTTTESVVESHRKITELRSSEQLPELMAGIPLLLEVDPALDIDKLRHHFNFEIVSEEEGGFVIVASSDIDLSDFLEAIDGFAEGAKPRIGTATIASVHRLDDDLNQTQRLKLIVSEYLRSIWGTLDSVPSLIVDIGVTCLGTREIPKQPERWKRESDDDWARRVSDWANERIGAMSEQFDILIIQSSGNIRDSASAPRAGILDHLGAGRAYPDYLIEPSSRVANPAQSLQALSVGSVAYQFYQSTGWQSFVTNEAEPSSFSRSGLGLWNVIKPEVVEFGGDYLLSPGALALLGTPTEGRDCFPELVRSTKFGPGPEFDRDDIGTSYAASKVTHIAAHLQRVLPDEPCLLYRALIVQSARWPEWTRGTIVDTISDDICQRGSIGRAANLGNRWQVSARVH